MFKLFFFPPFYDYFIIACKMYKHVRRKTQIQIIKISELLFENWNLISVNKHECCNLAESVKMMGVKRFPYYESSRILQSNHCWSVAHSQQEYRRLEYLN